MTVPTSRPWKVRDLPSTHSLSIENNVGWEICRFYSVAPIDRANAELICVAVNSWANPDALRTQIHSLTQFAVTDSIDSPQESL